MIRSHTRIHRDSFNLLLCRIEMCNQLMHAFLPFQNYITTHTHIQIKKLLQPTTLIPFVADIFDVFITNVCFYLIECIFHREIYCSQNRVRLQPIRSLVKELLTNISGELLQNVQKCLDTGGVGFCCEKSSKVMSAKCLQCLQIAWRITA